MNNTPKVFFIRRHRANRKQPITVDESCNDFVTEAAHSIDTPYIVGNGTSLEIRMAALRGKACDAIFRNRILLFKDHVISLSGGCYV